MPSKRSVAPMSLPKQEELIIHGDHSTLQHWLMHYWEKLQIPPAELRLLAMTQDRQEFKQWTGKRVNSMALGCYCYIKLCSVSRQSKAASGEQATHRHIIFIEPDMQPQSIEVTVAHELIHLADRVKGTPRRHRHHGYDSIAADEAAITGYTMDDLRNLLHAESVARERACRERRPIRYLYECPNCGKEYPRTRRYSQAVSCSHCDTSYNSRFRLVLTPVEANGVVTSS
jgi:ribosomal protein L37AE/L43A